MFSIQADGARKLGLLLRLAPVAPTYISHVSNLSHDIPISNLLNKQHIYRRKGSVEQSL